MRYTKPTYLVFATSADISTKLPLLLIEAIAKVIEFICRAVDQKVDGVGNVELFYHLLIPVRMSKGTSNVVFHRTRGRAYSFDPVRHKGGHPLQNILRHLYLGFALEIFA